MYKRPQNKNAFQYKEPKAKMRKLDVSFGGAGSSSQVDNPSAVQLSKPSTSKVTNDKPIATTASAHTTGKQNVVPQTNNLPPAKDDNLWGDADDECILIASQMVDNMDMDAINQQIIVQSMNLSQNNGVETKIQNEAQNIWKDFFHSTEEDDRIFSEMNNFDNIGNQDMNELLSSTVIQKTPHQQASQRPTSPSVFKVPMQIRNDKRVTVQTSTQIDMNITFRPEGMPQSTQLSQKIEIPRPMEPVGNFESNSKEFFFY